MSSYLSHVMSRVNVFLDAFYDDPETPCPSAFLMAPCDELSTGGQVLVRELQGSFELGIQFGTALHQAFQTTHGVDQHDIGIVSEEVSHFRHLVAAAHNSTQLTLLDLEVLGEIDRFLALAHVQCILPQYSPQKELRGEASPASLGGLCAMLFENRRFSCSSEALPLYLKAETVALKHLQKAFQRRWTETVFDGRSWDEDARKYLIHLREAVMARSHSVRLFLECA